MQNLRTCQQHWTMQKQGKILQATSPAKLVSHHNQTQGRNRHKKHSSLTRIGNPFDLRSPYTPTYTLQTSTTVLTASSNAIGSASVLIPNPRTGDTTALQSSGKNALLSCGRAISKERSGTWKKEKGLHEKRVECQTAFVGIQLVMATSGYDSFIYIDFGPQFWT
jgi:hypothetical protein